jgi:hypothetical protein
MPRRKNPCFRQKPILYFDENFPQTARNKEHTIDQDFGLPPQQVQAPQ